MCIRQFTPFLLLKNKNTMSKYANLRLEYKKEQLNEEIVLPNPLSQFDVWFQEAVQAEVPEPNAFALATSGPVNIPSVRIVLLKGVDRDGFVFYTNYKSDKAKDIAYNSHVGVCFLWHELERQVRVMGRATKISRKESETYFHSRPRESQIGAWVSPQSKVIKSREVLDAKLADVVSQYQNEEIIPLPDQWGGYRIIPEEIEFWQGRPNRLHDRILYKMVDGKWEIVRLAP